MKHLNSLYYWISHGSRFILNSPQVEDTRNNF